MSTPDETLAETTIDGVALKPTEVDVRVADRLPFETICLDYEGRDALPARETLADLAADRDLRVTTPVRADGFDPLGDDSLLADLPSDARRVLVAGHPAYLTDEERDRAVAPRLGAAVETTRDPWVGTESVERVALAAGGTQYELLARDTRNEVRALRAAGFDGRVAVYAPVVVSDEEDRILDAVGAYTARRGPVRRALPDDAATDGTATGRAREVLSKAVRDYALVGDAATIRERVAALREAGVDTVIGYPAAGL